MARCPSVSDLEAHALGRVTDPPIGTHVGGCAACREQVEEIRDNQEFLRGAAPALADALDRIVHSDLSTRPAGRPGPVSPPSIPGYELIEEIGRGGQGVVYSAVQTATKRLAAVKMILGGAFASERQRQRFDREVEVAARLRHPNIVSIFESGETTDGQPYVAMELVTGLPLDAYVTERFGVGGMRGLGSVGSVGVGVGVGSARGLRTRVDEVMRLVSAVVAGVSHAHSSGVIHRDLKPSNIIVDTEGHPRLLDFGLARPTDSAYDVSVTMEFVGTPAYASPEQLCGDPAAINARTDVYALGLIMYRVLTGKHPYPCDGTISEVTRHARATEPIPPSRHIPRLPSDVETIVLKCLAKDPLRRYPGAAVLASDIEDYLAGRAISARRDSALYVLRRLAMKHRIPAAAALLVLATILTGTIGLAQLAGDLDRARRRSDSALSDSIIQRARLMASVGDVNRAEHLLWAEALSANMTADASLCVGGTSQQLRSAWSLVELYARNPRLFRAAAGPAKVSSSAMGIDPVARTVWCCNAAGSRRTWSLDGRLLETTPTVIEPDQALWARTDPKGLVAAIQSRDSLTVRELGSNVTIAGPVPWQKERVILDVSDDGALLLFRNADVTEVVDARTLRKIAEFGPRAFSARFQRRPEGLLVLIGTGGDDDDTAVVIRQAPDWKIIRTVGMPPGFYNSRGNGIRNPRLAPDGLNLVATMNEGSVLFTIGPGTPSIVAQHWSRSTVSHADFDEVGGTIAAGCNDGTVTVLRVPDLSPLATFPNTEAAAAISTRADVGITVIADVAGRISAYETGDRPWLKRVSASEVNKQSLALAPDGTLAWGDDHGVLTIRSSKLPVHTFTLQAHVGGVSSIAFSLDGAEILTAGLDGAIRAWRLEGSLSRTIAEGLPPVRSARISPDGRTIASSGDSGSVHLWRDHDTRPTLTIETHAHRVPMLAFSPDGRTLVTAASPGLMRVWVVETGAEAVRLAHPESHQRAVVFSPDGAVIAAGGDDRCVRLFDAATGEQLRAIEGLPWAVFDLKFHPGGRLLFAIGRGGDVAVLDPIAGAELARLPVYEKIAFSIGISPDGCLLYLSGQDSWIGIIDLDRLRSYIRGNETFWRQAWVTRRDVTVQRQ